MVPLDRFRRLCNRQYVVGQEYRLDVVEERSRAAHNRYFALVEEAFRTLPEDISDQFPSPTHLRKWSLCKCGYAKVADYPARDREDAYRIAAIVRDMDGYAVILVEDDVVRVCTAFSQSRRAMKKKMFMESSDAVLHLISTLIGTDVSTLKAQAPKQRAPASPMRQTGERVPDLASNGEPLQEAPTGRNRP